VDEQSHPWPRAESTLLTAHVPGHDRNAPPLLAAAGPRAAQIWASRPNLGQWLGFCVNTGLLPGEATPGPAEILLLQALPPGCSPPPSTPLPPSSCGRRSPPRSWVAGNAPR
jgi:hypothetical protein